MLTLPQHHGRQDLVGVLAQFKHARRIGVAGICLELQAQLTKAEDRQRKAGKQRGLDDAGNDAQPYPYVGKGQHGRIPELVGTRNSPYVSLVTVKLERDPERWRPKSKSKTGFFQIAPSVHHDRGVVYAFPLDDAEQGGSGARMQADAAMRCRSAEPGNLVAPVDRVTAVKKDRMRHGRVVVDR